MMIRKQNEIRLLYRFVTVAPALLNFDVLFLLDPSRQWDKFFDREFKFVIQDIYLPLAAPFCLVSDGFNKMGLVNIESCYMPLKEA